MDISEEDLVEQLVSGNEDAYRKLLDRHLPSLTGYVMRMMSSNSADAEDILQETFLRLWTHGRRYDPKVSKLSTWLHNIAHNLCIDYFRKNNRIVLEEQPEELTDQDAHLENLANLENAAQIERCMMQLPERQRSAIIMCHYQGMSNKDAAVILGTSVEALESLMARGRRKMRQLLTG